MKTDDELQAIYNRRIFLSDVDSHLICELIVRLQAAQSAAAARVAELEAAVAAAQHLTDAAIDFGVNDGSQTSTNWLLSEAVGYYKACRAQWDKEQVTP